MLHLPHAARRLFTLPCALLLVSGLGAGAPVWAEPALAPVAATPAQPDPAAQPPSALPPLPDQSDPWLYRGSDIPHDREWYFGTLPNGLRWAVRRNDIPPGQVSIRIRMDVGSLNEAHGEEGFAHLIEHLVFRQSRYLGEAQAIPTWQRLGATFGTDTNADTSPLHTVFKIDLPDASADGLNESMKLLSGMMIAPTLSESDIRTEVPIVLAEKRERGGVAERIDDAVRAVVYAGQPMADHAPIGSVTSVSGAHEAAVRAFHARWYRPENAAIMISGDADPRLMAALITKWFGDWPVAGPHTPTPDFGTPQPVAGADPANPVGPARVIVEPEAPRSLSYAIERPWHEKFDTIVYNQGLMTDQVAEAIINRRLETRARAGASFLAAHVEDGNENRSINATFVTITPQDGQWRAALDEVRGVIAEAQAHPPSQEEIAREIAEVNVVFESQVQQRALQPGKRVADDLVEALDIHETVASPETVLALFRRTIPLFTADAILEHTRHLFAGSAIRAVYVTPQAGEASDAALMQALLAPVKASATGLPVAKPVSFADLPPIGPEGPEPRGVPNGVGAIEQLDLGNDVKVLMWPTVDDPGRVTVRVRFGSGLRAFAPGQIAAATLGRLALYESGEGRLGQEELDAATAGRRIGYALQVEDGNFLFAGDTRAEDLADELYLMADKFAAPRWDAAPVRRAAALARGQYDEFSASPQGVLERDLRFLQHGGAARYATPTPARIAAMTPERFREVWAPILAHGPIEIELFGDFKRAAGIEALRRSFGALPPRGPEPVTLASDHPGFAAPNARPLILTHKGDTNQAAAVVAWPTGGGAAGIHISRQIEVLANVFENRLLLAMREKAGASYAPQVGSEWPVDLADGGAISAAAQLQPDRVSEFFATADAIAADLAARPPSADEMALVIAPLRQQVARAERSTGFYMSQIEGATRDPSRIAAAQGILGDYTNVTPELVRQLARRYLLKARAWRLAVMPEHAALLDKTVDVVKAGKP